MLLVYILDFLGTQLRVCRDQIAGYQHRFVRSEKGADQRTLIFWKAKKKIFKIRIHKGGARLVLNSYVDVNLRKIVHVSLFFLKVSYAPIPSFLVAMCFYCILIACIRIKENMTLKCHEQYMCEVTFEFVYDRIMDNISRTRRIPMA